MARLAWFERSDQAQIFVNGRSRRCHSLLLAAFKIVAAARMIDAATIDAFNATSEGRELLAWMLRQGSADLGDPA